MTVRRRWVGLAVVMSLCLGLGAGAGWAGANLKLEPPLDPVAGTFVAVAYWRAEPAPTTVTLRLENEVGATAWQTQEAFSAQERRASARCATAALPDGAYRLIAQAGDETDSTTIRLHQGREVLPDKRPFARHMLWLPMTGCTDGDIDEAAAAGYDTLFTKVGPPAPTPGVPLDFTEADVLIHKAQARGMKVVVAWLLWGGLPPGRFSLLCADGSVLENRIDPCNTQAVALARRYGEMLLDHYMGCADVLGLAPTWGIYGEGGYDSMIGGYTPEAQAAFNSWLIGRGEPPMAQLPVLYSGQDPYHEILFSRFRFEHNTQVWGELNAHLRQLEPYGVAIGAWQEIYNGLLFGCALNEVPGAAFAVNEMAFPWGTTYDQPRAIGETMGTRYVCNSYEDYRDYYRPLIARKWAEGQQAIGCQLDDAYADENFKAWPKGRAKELGFSHWEDRFTSEIRRVRDTPIIDEPPQVAYVQMTYPAAGYPDMGQTVADINLTEIVLRQYGVAYERISVTRLQRMRAEELDRFKAVVLPGAWYLDEALWLKLRSCRAAVLLTGGALQYSDGGAAPASGREVDGLRLIYGKTAGGVVSAGEACPAPLREGLAPYLDTPTFALPPDLGLQDVAGATPLLWVGGQPLVSEWNHLTFITNRLFFACAFDPQRQIPHSSGSADASADASDPWGLASSQSPRNAMGEQIFINLLRLHGVEPRLLDPAPRIATKYLGDHVEAVNVTGNIVVNQSAEARTVRVLCRWPVRRFPCTRQGERWVAEVKLPPFDFVALERAE